MGDYLLIALVTLVAAVSCTSSKCWPRDYGFGSVVCVCNVRYCDFLGDVRRPPSARGKVVAFESNKAGLRFDRTILHLDSKHDPYGGNSTVVLQINPQKTYQMIFGFGGAFTDAVGINLRKLPDNMQDDVIKSYYSKEGLEYTIGRIPIASTDFSVRDSWSAPAWMKTSNSLSGRGFLKGEPGGLYYKTWARYIVRFVREYKRQGIPMWGLTTQNEPTSGFIPFYPWQTMGFSPQSERDFIKLDLGPELQKAGYGPNRLKLMILDDNRIVLRYWAKVVLGDPEAAKYISGVALHWYRNRGDRTLGPGQCAQ
ncbi:hypothetical protein MTO96_022127 [Rhipicephalus appendiculatus]